MDKAKRISLIFFLIFLFGLIGFIMSINLTLNKKTKVDVKSAQLYMDEQLTYSEGSFFYLN
ncbi:hypothetical protein SAMN05660776_1536 [Salegentibacter holothuriorum]|uniref:Uncharacterized protein n=1 Tax=Salegentibacter holothuriorum TaxID=241145 RepID=A0A1T5BVW4_9FLAO|nr:hypothetical protein [Salegentibacter holothuriorum]SKB51281.1 hypothetical protein SAMN05660776_1536 [Salegentibacter holothuriorum]